MANAQRAGGLYRGPNGFHDAEGEAIPLEEVAEIDSDLLTKEERKELGGTSKKGSKKSAEKEPENDLPDIFPGRTELLKAGVTAMDTVRAIAAEQGAEGFQEIDGIGPKTSADIVEAVNSEGAEGSGA